MSTDLYKFLVYFSEILIIERKSGTIILYMTSERIKNMLSQRLKSTRKAKGLTQSELARKVNTTKGTVSNYENGYSTPSNEMLVSLANALDVSVDYLLGRTNYLLALEDHNDYLTEPKNMKTLKKIFKLMQKYDIEDSSFLDFEKWGSMGPEQIRELENYFQYLVQKSKDRDDNSGE